MVFHEGRTMGLVLGISLKIKKGHTRALEGITRGFTKP